MCQCAEREGGVPREFRSCVSDDGTSVAGFSGIGLGSGLAGEPDRPHLASSEPQPRPARISAQHVRDPARSEKGGGGPRQPTHLNALDRRLPGAGGQAEIPCRTIGKALGGAEQAGQVRDQAPGPPGTDVRQPRSGAEVADDRLVVRPGVLADAGPQIR